MCKSKSDFVSFNIIIITRFFNINREYCRKAMKVKKSYTKSAPKKRPVFAEITEINEAQTMENEETI